MILNHDNDINSNISFYELFNELDERRLKQFFPDANQCDIQELKNLIEKKIIELKENNMYSVIYSIDTFKQDVLNYINELRTQYGEIGLKKIYNKIIKVYSILEFDNKRTDDFIIVKKIKEEYLANKKLLSSTMLYLNKIYKELNIIRDDEQEENHSQTKSIQNKIYKSQESNEQTIW